MANERKLAAAAALGEKVFDLIIAEGVTRDDGDVVINALVNVLGSFCFEMNVDGDHPADALREFVHELEAAGRTLESTEPLN